MPPVLSAMLVAEQHEIRENPRDLGVGEHRDDFLCCLDHRLVGLVRDLDYLLLLGFGRQGPLVVLDEGSIGRGSPSESSLDVDEVFDLGEMADPGLDMTV